MGDFADDYNGVNDYPMDDDMNIEDSLKDRRRYHSSLDEEFEEENDLDGLDFDDD